MHLSVSVEKFEPHLVTKNSISVTNQIHPSYSELESMETLLMRNIESISLRDPTPLGTGDTMTTVALLTEALKKLGAVRSVYRTAVEKSMCTKERLAMSRYYGSVQLFVWVVFLQKGKVAFVLVNSVAHDQTLLVISGCVSWMCVCVCVCI